MKLKISKKKRTFLPFMQANLDKLLLINTLREESVCGRVLQFLRFLPKSAKVYSAKSP